MYQPGKVCEWLMGIGWPTAPPRRDSREADPREEAMDPGFDAEAIP